MKKKFTPTPGDKIICNNGEEFICCTLETLMQKYLSARPLPNKTTYSYKENDGVVTGWQSWHNKGETAREEWNIREVIPQSVVAPADKKEEVKEESRYTVEEVFYAIKEHCGKYDSPLGCEFEIKNLLKRFDEDPEYKEYLRLKAIYE